MGFALQGCLLLVLMIGFLVGLTAAYLFWPGQTNILLLGVDYADPGSWVARTDTIILSTFNPADGYVGLVSVPRDLWVVIPGYGENRINTAHFFAEADQPWSGAYHSMVTVEQNFAIDLHYFARLRFEGFKDVVNALGGVEIVLSEPMAGYPAGAHFLTGNKALAFVRDRSHADDFSRMKQGQIMLKAIAKNLLQPGSWSKIPAVIQAIFRNLHTDVPRWLWPRLAFALLWVGPDNLDYRVIEREMVIPTITDQGAAILLPRWEMILPMVHQIFSR